jgi:hypothetical protein
MDAKTRFLEAMRAKGKSQAGKKSVRAALNRGRGKGPKAPQKPVNEAGVDRK